MNQLQVINQDGRLLVDSRDVSVMTDTRHGHLLTKIEGYIKILSTEPNFRLSDFFTESTYQDGTGRKLKCFLLTKNGCDMVANKMTGEKGVLFTATYVTRFSEMERELKAPNEIERFLYNPDTILQIAQNWKAEQDARKELESKIEADKPKTLFAEAVATSQDCILIGQLATMLKQNGVNIGQTRLFNYLREEGYLCKSGDRRNLPTQRSMDLKLFEVKEFTVHGNTGIRVKATPKVTGRGQVYFFNKFLKTAS